MNLNEKSSFGRVRLTVRSTLLLLTAGPCLALALLSAVAFAQAKLLAASFAPLIESSLPATETLGKMLFRLSKARIELRSIGWQGNSAEDDRAIAARAKSEMAKLDDAIRAGAPYFDTKEEMETFAALTRAWDDYKSCAAEAIALVEADGELSAERARKISALIRETCPKRVKAVEGGVDSLVRLESSEAQELANAAKREAQAAAFWILGAGAAVILSLLAASWLTSRKLSQSLGQATAGVGAASASVGATAHQVSSAAQDVMAAVHQQATAIDQTSAALEEISAMASRSAARAAEVLAASSRSRENAEAGKRTVDRLSAAMIGLRDSNDGSAKSLKESEDRVAQVVKIIDDVAAKTRVINDIVFQTKLLSFNASVEAARAGEHGKGFAVVAEEVGNLARMSGEAAREINLMLDSSMSQVKSTIEENRARIDEMVSTSNRLIADGLEVTRECDSALNSILESTKEASQMVDEIASGSQESARGVEEITRAIQDIRSSSGATSRAAAACEESSGSLSHDVKRLRDVASGLSATVNGKPWISKFAWKDDYLLRVDAMDDEHKVLVEKINAFATTLERGAGEGARAAFQDLATYTAEHFGREEAFMERIQYPDLDVHKQIHANLLAGVAQYARELEAGAVDTVGLMTFLNDWLLKHILGVDMKYANWSRGERVPSAVQLRTAERKERAANASKRAS